MSTYDLSSRKVSALHNMEVKWVVKKDNNNKDSKDEKVVTNLDYPKFIIPQEADMKPKQVLTSLVHNQGSYIAKVGTAPSLTLPKSAGSGTWTYTRAKVFHIPHIEMYRRMVKAGLTIPAQLAANYVRCNNTPQAMVKRLQERLTATVQYKRVPDYTQVHPHLFCDLTKYTFEDFSQHHPCFDNINPSAEAGMPYAFCLGGNNKQTIPKFEEMTWLPINYRDEHMLDDPIPIKDHAMAWAHKFREMAEHASDANMMITRFKELIMKYPELNTFIAKRKDEKIKRDSYNLKVRTYGVMPSSLKLFFKWCAHPLETNLVPFFKDPNSCSAYHFSFFYGGARRLVDWLDYWIKIKKTDNQIKNRGKWDFHGICYGDDQWWLFVHELFGIFLTGPDVSGMDLSTSSDIAKHFAAWVTKMFGDKQELVNGLVLNCFVAFRHFLHIGGPYIVSKLNSLMSGVTLTTIFNIFTSSVMQHKIEILMDRLDLNDKPFQIMIKEVIKMIKEDMNFEFKDIKDGVPDFQQLNYPLQEDINVPFLGAVLKYDKDRQDYFAYPKGMDMLVAGLVLPGNFGHPSKYMMERVLGVFMSGACFDPQYEVFLRETFMACSKTEKFDEVGAFEFLGPEEAHRDMVKLNSLFNDEHNKLQFKKGLLPSIEFMKDMYMTEYDEFSKWYTYVNEQTQKNMFAVYNVVDEKTFGSNDCPSMAMDKLFDLDLNVGSKTTVSNPILTAINHSTNDSLDSSFMDLQKSQLKPTLVGVQSLVCSCNNNNNNGVCYVHPVIEAIPSTNPSFSETLKLVKNVTAVVNEETDIPPPLPPYDVNKIVKTVITYKNNKVLPSDKLEMVSATDKTYTVFTAGHGNAKTKEDKEKKQAVREYRKIQLNNSRATIKMAKKIKFKGKDILNEEELEELKQAIIDAEVDYDEEQLAYAMKHMDIHDDDNISAQDEEFWEQEFDKNEITIRSDEKYAKVYNYFLNRT